jgi:hypothetical protein
MDFHHVPLFIIRYLSLAQCFRKTLEALTTVDVHQRVVVEKLLEKQVHSAADFFIIR